MKAKKKCAMLKMEITRLHEELQITYSTVDARTRKMNEYARILEAYTALAMQHAEKLKDMISWPSE